MRKLRKILLSTIFALTVSTTFFANTAGTQTVTAASGTAVTFKRKVIAYRTGSVYNFVPMGNAWRAHHQDGKSSTAAQPPTA